MVLTARTYEQIALDEPERAWELYDGELREKPPMSMGHDLVQLDLIQQLAEQLDRTRLVKS